MKKLIISIIILCSFSVLARAENGYTLDRIIVRQVSSDYDEQVLTSAEIKEKNLDTLVEVLNYVSGLDLRTRGPMGVQSDISLKGSTYEQVSVSIDGIRVMDPQTGHYNLDIPLTSFDVERIEITKEGDSSSYGAGALAGSVNIVTRKPVKKSLNLDTLFGAHALFGQTASVGYAQDDFMTRVSFEHKISKAARPNTDFEYKTASAFLSKELHNISLDALFGYQKKDYGADSFYSNLFPEEEEHTQTLFLKTGINPKLENGYFKNNIFLRKHRDKFVLQRNNPTSVNYHTTYVYGLNSDFSLPIKYGDFSTGLDIGNDAINSTNLGKHGRLHQAGSLGFMPAMPERFSSELKLRVDNYQKWGLHESHNLALGYYIIENILKVNASLSRSFRIPSFTELYYSDAANKGNDQLKVERSDNAALGLLFKSNKFELGLDGFFRRGDNLIDWTRPDTNQVWKATNLGSVDFSGGEFNVKIKPGYNFKGVRLDKLLFSYSYTDAHKKTSSFLSKYALDILKHQYLLDIYSGIFGIGLNWHLSYNQRDYGETYFVGNIYIGKKLKSGSLGLEPFVQVDNFSNTSYSEVAGVLQPGRWVKGGLKFEW